jgi:hypothetical protein
VQKSIHLMERTVLGAGPRLAVELAQSSRANLKEVVWNFLGAVEVIVQSIGHILLIDVVAVE